MPKNSYLGQRNVNPDVSDVSSHAFAPTESFAQVRNIPSGGTALILPPNPSNGEWYGFFNPDGSASPSNPLILEVENGTGQEIAGQTSLTFPTAYQWGVAIFNDVSNTWSLQQGTSEDTVGIAQNRVTTEQVSGIAIGANGANIVPALSFTPKYTGKVSISCFASWAAPGSGDVVTPGVTYTPSGSGLIVAIQFAQFGNVVGEVAATLEIDGLIVGKLYTFQFESSVGDAAFTIGHGSNGAIAAALTVAELP